MRRAFLKWALVNVLFLSALVLAAFSYDGHIHAVGKLAVAAVFAIYLISSAHAGYEAWHFAGSGIAATHHLDLSIRACPMLAMLGTVGGFLVAFGGGLEDVQGRVLGASTGLAATFVGVSCALVLMVHRHLLEHAR